jgi:hypothetical protein
MLHTGRNLPVVALRLPPANSLNAFGMNNPNLHDEPILLLASSMQSAFTCKIRIRFNMLINIPA